jgi:hypothetical protein
METLSYRYKPKHWSMLLAFLFFGAIAFSMGHEAKTNDRGLILNGVIYFSPHGATIFYWCVAVGSAAFVALGIPGFVVGVFSSHHLTLTATDISVRKYGFSPRLTVVLLADITSLNVQKVQGHRFLNIHHGKGKLAVSESFLPDAVSFEQVCSALASRRRASGD